jgi:hypothetical protein
MTISKEFIEKSKEKNMIISEDDKYLRIVCAKSGLRVPASGKITKFRIDKKDYSVTYYLPKRPRYADICWGDTGKESEENKKLVRGLLRNNQYEDAITVLLNMFPCS